MPRILGRHELFPRVNQKPWLGSGCSFGSTDSATTATSRSLRKSTSSKNLSVHLSDDRQNYSSRSSAGTHRLQGLAYRIEHGDDDDARQDADNAWGYYVDFVEGERSEPATKSKHTEGEIFGLETSMMELALRRSSR